MKNIENDKSIIINKRISHREYIIDNVNDVMDKNLSKRLKFGGSLIDDYDDDVAINFFNG